MMPLCVGDTKVGVVTDAADVGTIELGSVVHVGAVGYAGDVASRGGSVTAGAGEGEHGGDVVSRGGVTVRAVLMLQELWVTWPTWA